MSIGCLGLDTIHASGGRLPWMRYLFGCLVSKNWTSDKRWTRQSDWFTRPENIMSPFKSSECVIQLQSGFFRAESVLAVALVVPLFA